MLIFNLGSWFKIRIRADFELGSFALQNSNKTLVTATSMSPKAIQIIEENEMKTKQTFAYGIFAVVIGIAFIGCDNENNNGNPDPVLCTCTPTEHYLPCTCGGTDCACTVIPRGYVTDTNRNINFPIYQTVGVDDEQAITATANIITAFVDVTESNKDALANANVDLDIWIVKVTENQTRYYDFSVVGNKVILKFQYDSQLMINGFNRFIQVDLPTIPTETEETHREFTIILEGFEDHPITVIDTRTGSNDTDLETLGVIARLEAGLKPQSGEHIDRAIGYGLVIEVEETTEYTRFQARSGNRMGANITYLLSDDENFLGRVSAVLSSMISMEPDEL